MLERLGGPLALNRVEVSELTSLYEQCALTVFVALCAGGRLPHLEVRNLAERDHAANSLFIASSTTGNSAPNN